MLSYQALDRACKQRSEAVIKETGLGGAVPGIGPSLYPPPFPASSMMQRPGVLDPYSSHPEDSRRSRRYFEDDPIMPYPPHAVPRSRLRSVSPTPPPRPESHNRAEAARQERPEVRFTLPHALLASGPANPSEPIPITTSNPRELSPPKPNAKEELLKLRQRLKQAQEKLMICIKSGDHSTQADLKYYVIPDLEARIFKGEAAVRMEEITRKKIPRKDDDKSNHQAEIETESEESDDDPGDLYD